MDKQGALVVHDGAEQENCYKGPLINNIRNGEGTYSYPNRYFKYEGTYVDGMKHGMSNLL